MRHKACANAIKASAASLEQKVTTSPNQPQRSNLHQYSNALISQRNLHDLMLRKKTGQPFTRQGAGGRYVTRRIDNYHDGNSLYSVLTCSI